MLSGGFPITWQYEEVPIRALVVGQSLNPEILRILDDFAIEQVRFTDRLKSPRHLFESPTGYRLLIVNRSTLPHKWRRRLLHLAQTHRIELLEFGSLPRSHPIGGP